MFISKTKKSPFYQLTYEVDGKKTTISTKAKNRTDAHLFLIYFQKKRDGESKEQIKSISLTKFKEEYDDYIKPTKSKSYLRSINLSFKMLIAFSGDISLSRLDIHTIDKFITHTFSRTPRGASLYYRTLKAAFSKAVLWNYITENPLKKIKTPKVSKAFPVFISETELKTILENTQEEYLKDLFLTAFYTGMRLGELVNMKWSWVDLKQNQITVQCSEFFTTKSKKERIIPFNSNLKKIFMNRFPKVVSIKNDEYIFSKLPGIKFNEDFISKKFKDFVRAAKLDERIHFHTLRHSFASLLVQRGVSLYVVKELLGHEELSTTQIYSHLQQQNLRDAVNLL
ncbi:MAG: tyrosine-type recombinase/integrase [Ignavibacteriales bacterium]|nr:tyrosine-type recombinase/integrase [Ignavibacteriales bacterium]